MFNGIQTRLTISYILVIVLSLSLALFLLVLLARPLQIRTTELQLSSELNQVIPALQSIIAKNVNQPRSFLRVLDNLHANLPPLNDRLLLVDSHGKILLDSQDKWDDEQIALPKVQRRVPIFQREDVFSGRATAPDGQSLLVVARAITPRLFLAVVAPYPRTAVTVVRELSLGFWVAGMVALFAAVILGALIARSLATPLKQIARASDAVAAGDYSQQVSVSGPTEVRQVAGAFNSMTAQVQQSQQAMKDFVSNVSHDLKTPLTSIQGFSQALLDGTATDSATRIRAARIINDEATRMRRMVEELLDLARIESGQVNIEPHPLEIGTLLSVTLDSLATQFAQKNITLSTNIAVLPSVMGDADRLKQVFSNLLDNALKFTPAGGKISVIAQISAVPTDVSTVIHKRNAAPPPQKFVRISVTDSGPGIPQSELNRIFERFYQVDKSRQNKRGTGLGLAIAFNIVKAHRGYIDAKSTMGQGTTFSVWLPVAT